MSTTKGTPALSLEGRVAVVLGGTSGLGLAVTCALAEAGAAVVPSSRRPEAVEDAAIEVEQRGRTTLRRTSDVGDRSSLEKLRAACLERFGQVDVLVNCAGRTQRRPTLEVTEEEWTAVLDTVLTGTLRSCQVFGKPMLERGYGRIVNIASLASFVSFLEVAAYGAAKAGVVALTRSLAQEWGPRGVQVNAIAPGVFPTDLNRALLDGTPRGQELLQRIPMGRFGRPEELAGAAVFLASEAAGYVCGEVLVVDGGMLATGVNR